MLVLLLAAHDPVDHVLPHSFFKLLPTNANFGLDHIPLLGFPLSDEFYFTNHLLMTLVSAGLCLLIFPRLARTYAGGAEGPTPPRGLFMNCFEGLLQFIREQVARPVLKHRTDRFMPFLWTLFFFILFCNLLGMIPLGEIIQFLTCGSLKHVGGTATGNLAITGGLAICAFFMIHVSGIREVYHGLVTGTYGQHGDEEHVEEEKAEERITHGQAPLAPGSAAILAFPLYVWNFAPHVFKPTPGTGTMAAALLHGVDCLMWAVLLVLELIGAVIKPFALMIRLFANMVAGHIVLASILLLIFGAKTVALGYTVGAISVLGCVALSCLELLVAFLQAYIFVFLTTLFLSMSVAPEH
ncbi:MAG: F0F1 ATP synthase subunit A [Phycisphaerae bacterium]|nr:F0F1 ATP synthase subunit A [Phycisphaerae bacterium]